MIQKAYDRNNIYIKELGMTMGQSWGALRKTWRQYKLALRYGHYERIEALKARISYIRKSDSIFSYIFIIEETIIDFVGIPADEVN